MFNVNFLQRALNQWREDYCRLPEAQRKEGTSSKAKNLESRRVELCRAQSGWGALCAWIELDGQDIASSSSAKKLLDAALGLLESSAWRPKALQAIGLMALQRDNPTAWLALRKEGMDTFKSPMGENEPPSFGWMNETEHVKLGWVALAIEGSHWKMAEMLIEQPEAKKWIPSLTDDEKNRERLEEMRDVFGTNHQKTDNIELSYMALHWQKAHPLLILWDRVEEEINKKTQRELSLKVLENKLIQAGLGPVWKSKSFEAAAVDLALNGVSLALSSCAAHGAKPSAAADFGLGGGECALSGGVLKSTKKDVKVWEGIKAWTNKVEPGFAEAAECLAAQNALQLMADRNWNISEHEVDLIEPYVARLVAGAELDQVKGAELAAEWLLWCVELAELATQRGANDSPSKARQALEEGLGQLDLSRAKSLGLAKPVKRILKV